MATMRTSTRALKVSGFGIAVVAWLALGFASDGGREAGAQAAARGDLLASDHRTTATLADDARLDRIEEASSPDFPTTPGAFDSTSNGDGDAFVVKFSRFFRRGSIQR